MEDFYYNLYKSKGSLSEAEFHPFTSDLSLLKISDDEREALEGVLSFDECKEALDLLDLQNWRPITLLNIDYKIAAKAVARRIEQILNQK